MRVALNGFECWVSHRGIEKYDRFQKEGEVRRRSLFTSSNRTSHSSALFVLVLMVNCIAYISMPNRTEYFGVVLCIVCCKHLCFMCC